MTVRRLMTTGEAKRILDLRSLLDDVRLRCEQAGQDDELDEWKIVAVGRAAEAADQAADGLFNLVNVLVNYCDQEQLAGFLQTEEQPSDTV